MVHHWSPFVIRAASAGSTASTFERQTDIQVVPKFVINLSGVCVLVCTGTQTSVPIAVTLTWILSHIGVDRGFFLFLFFFGQPRRKPRGYLHVSCNTSKEKVAEDRKQNCVLVEQCRVQQETQETGNYPLRRSMQPQFCHARAPARIRMLVSSHAWLSFSARLVSSRPVSSSGFCCEPSQHHPISQR